MILLVGVSLLTTPASAVTYRLTDDPATGVRLNIPVDLVGEPTLDPRWGNDWQGSDLHIVTLNFGNQRSLADLYDSVSRSGGKTFRVNQRGSDFFVLAGAQDRGTTQYYVTARVLNGELRGLSITYETKAQWRLEPVVQEVARSFEPFPSRVVAAPPHPKVVVAPVEQQPDPTLQRLLELERRQADLVAKIRDQEERARQEQQAAQLTALRQDVQNKAALPRIPELRVGKRIALVIGNDSYPNLPGADLKNAVSDARSIEKALIDIGFDRVVRAENLGLHDMWDKVFDFLKRIEPTDLVVFYFSGHGVSIGGGNYLLPSDTRPVKGDEEARLRTMAISEADIIAKIQERRAAAAVMVLDACRNNPFPRKIGEKAIGVEETGLAHATNAFGVLAVYSAGVGQKALDRLSEDDRVPNSVFTRVLVAQLYRTDLEAYDVFRLAKFEVLKLAASADFEQLPGVYDQLPGRVFLSKNRGVADASTPVGGDQ